MSVKKWAGDGAGIQEEKLIAPNALLPRGHRPGMRVPEGGASCATCEYLRPGAKCANKFFQKWNGSADIPGGDPARYCSDWYEDASVSHPPHSEPHTNEEKAK